MLGGTFDPIHIGHLRAAIELGERLALDELRLIPSRHPPHRDRPGASGSQRLAMVQAAVADEPRLAVDDLELRREGPSYTIDTLQALRSALGPATALSLVVGADAFAGLDSWHRWRDMAALAHVIVVARPGFALPTEGPVFDYWSERRCSAETLATMPAGGVASVQLPDMPVSATAVRAYLREGRSVRWLVPDAVWRYISDHDLYNSPAV